MAEHPGLVEILGKLAEGIAVEGMESLIPALVTGEMQLLTDLVREGTHVLVSDPERVRSRAADLVRTAEEFLAASWSTAAEAGEAPIDLGDRKRTRLNSSHANISYAVFCLKKKKNLAMLARPSPNPSSCLERWLSVSPYSSYEPVRLPGSTSTPETNSRPRAESRCSYCLRP